jgi:hypothetical protein
MPFIVAAVNVVFWGLVLLLFGGVSVSVVRGHPPTVAVLAGLAIGYWFPALLFAAVPFQPYRGLFDRRGRGSLPRMKDLSELDRRVLVRFYDPTNRRRAAIYIVTLSLAILASWRFNVLALPPPRVLLPPSQVVISLLVMGFPLAFGTGIFAIGIEIRRNWPSIAGHGQTWPIDIKYPGSIRESIRSFLTGTMPPFLNGRIGRA